MTKAIHRSSIKSALARLVIISLLATCFTVPCLQTASAASVKYASGKAKSKIILRGSASTSSKKVKTLKKNTKVTICQEVFTKKGDVSSKKKWYAVKASGKSGYIRSDLLKSVSYSPIVKVTTDALNYRSGPDTKFKRIGTLNRGATITVVMTAKMKGSTSVWFKVKIGSKYYYVDSSYTRDPAVPIGSKISGSSAKITSCLHHVKGTAADGLIHTGSCSKCGKKVKVMQDSTTGVSFTSLFNTRSDRGTALVVNKKGFAYEYPLYLQNSSFKSYSHYMKYHGCSTCALTTVLNAVVPSLKTVTPDSIIENVERPLFGDEAFYKNYKAGMSKGDMPISLWGMTKIFDYYGVRYSLPSADKSQHIDQITNHLKNGNPVIVTFANGGAKGLSASIHTIVLIGIDSKGYVIIADSVHKKSANWGSDGLIKTGKVTVNDMYSYITSYGDWSVASNNYNKDSGHIFYKNRTDKGFLLVYGGK